MNLTDETHIRAFLNSGYTIVEESPKTVGEVKEKKEVKKVVKK